MVVNLQIKKKNLDLIEKGIKKTEWRDPSLYNKKLLFVEREDGKRIGNSEIKEILFINGYSPDSKKILIECLGIRLVKFSRNIKIESDNFEALEGQFSIEITLGNIISSQ